ncbi:MULTISPECIES: GNAT family N-acetyltransferase [unclassified Streptomyces]|uniref:GNAT family N-acetyltransferase n=1 Tax=unclassified Streptomyces TaxID=2593676 RepID=UPI0007DD4BF7|nr:GNAT family N-acetyltransferase [Streptomyces sp. SAT1]ANH89782.1 GNAT family acetyltransferase [Streptomyces sp. SAT1]
MTPPPALRPAPTALRPPHPVVVRAAGPGDVAALYRLSRAFARTGELRARSATEYARDTGDFLIAESAAGGVEGCVGLGCGQGAAARTAVVYNFCVAAASQGRGVGTALLATLLAEAAARSVGTVFTATSGGAALFLRHGFTVVDPATAAWPAGLDPRPGSSVLSLRL